MEFKEISLKILAEQKLKEQRFQQPHVTADKVFTKNSLGKSLNKWTTTTSKKKQQNKNHQALWKGKNLISRVKIL